MGLATSKAMIKKFSIIAAICGAFAAAQFSIGGTEPAFDLSANRFDVADLSSEDRFAPQLTSEVPRWSLPKS